MRYIYAQSAHLRFQWELDVALTNLYSLDPNADVVVLFSDVGGESQRVYEHITSRYPQAEVHMYLDTRPDKEYSATHRPFLWYCYLSEDPAREKAVYFQSESDVIFRELPDFSKIKFNRLNWYGSDCGGYIDGKYLASVKRGNEIIEAFARIIDVPRVVIEKTPGAGAQWILVEPSAAYWLKVYEDCNKLYRYLQGVDSNIQKWTAEMWAQLYNAPYFGIKQHISKELSFCRPTDPVAEWDRVKMLHNAGVVGELGDVMFYKSKYVTETPFAEDLSWVRRDKASIKYVEAIKKVVL